MYVGVIWIYLFIFLLIEGFKKLTNFTSERHILGIL